MSIAGNRVLGCAHVHEYLNSKGGKFSKSRGGAVEVPYFLSKYDPDALRFYLTATLLETRDTEFSWEDFVERNNNELVATWTARRPGSRSRRTVPTSVSGPAMKISPAGTSSPSSLPRTI